MNTARIIPITSRVSRSFNLQELVSELERDPIQLEKYRTAVTCLTPSMRLLQKTLLASDVPENVKQNSARRLLPLVQKHLQDKGYDTEAEKTLAAHYVINSQRNDGANRGGFRKYAKMATAAAFLIGAGYLAGGREISSGPVPAQPTSTNPSTVTTSTPQSSYTAPEAMPKVTNLEEGIEVRFHIPNPRNLDVVLEELTQLRTTVGELSSLYASVSTQQSTTLPARYTQRITDIHTMLEELTTRYEEQPSQFPPEYQTKIDNMYKTVKALAQEARDPMHHRESISKMEQLRQRVVRLTDRLSGILPTDGTP